MKSLRAKSQPSSQTAHAAASEFKHAAFDKPGLPVDHGPLFIRPDSRLCRGREAATPLTAELHGIPARLSAHRENRPCLYYWQTGWATGWVGLRGDCRAVARKIKEEEKKKKGTGCSVAKPVCV